MARTAIHNQTKLRSRGLVWLCVVFLLSFSSSSFAELTEEQKQKFEQVKQNIEKIKAELEKTKGSRDKLQETLEGNEKNIQKLNQKTKKLKTELDQKQSRLNNLNQEQQQLSKKKSAQTKLVEEHIAAAYRLGKHSQIQLLLNQKDPAEVSRMMKYYESFSASRTEKIETFVATLTRLNELEPIIANETQKLQTAFSRLKAEQKKLSQSQKSRQQTLAKLEADVRSQSQTLSGLEADRNRLESLLSSVYAEINAQELDFDLSEFSQLKGQLPWPAKGKIQNRYGRSRSGSQLKWQGLEIEAARGTEVISVHHGQVVFSDYLRGHGLLIIVDHGSGYMSLYAHNENLYKELGEWVAAGEAIASVGDTGGRRDTALYFELRHNGKPTNPTPWLRRV